MKYCRIVLYLILCMISVTGIYAQSYFFKHYEVEEGLSNNNVNCAIQDKFGFMWFGTRDGLNRFDGNTFKLFKDDPDKTGSLASSWITCLALDTTGSLWLGTYMGVYKYDYISESFRLLDFTKGMGVTQLTFDKQNNLWMILNQATLAKYNEQLNHHQVFTLPDNIAANAFCITPQDKIWIAMANGYLTEYNPDENRFSSFNVFEDTQDIHSLSIPRLYASPTLPLIFIGTEKHGVKIFDTQKNRYQNLLLINEERQTDITVRDFLQVSEDEVWVATESGLYIYRISSNTYTYLFQDNSDPYAISNNAVKKLYQDHEGGIWLCTYNGGVSYHSPHQFFQKHYTQYSKNSLTGNVVHDIRIDAYNNVWIGTEDAGINKLDTKTGLYTNYQFNPGKHYLSDNCIHGIEVIGDRLWIGTHMNGIDLMDIQTGQIVRHYAIGDDTKSGKNNTIVNMYKTRKNQLLVATAKGMYSYNPAKDLFEIIPQLPVLNRIQTIYEDHRGVIWAGTFTKGLFFYDPGTGKYGAFPLDSISKASNNTINHIHEDKNQNLWFATGEGLKRYDRATASVLTYTTKNGLPSNVTFQIQEDESGNLWVSTTNGLVSLDIEMGKFTTYTKSHGLITNQFNYNSSAKAPDGRMYFGTIKGMISFNPKEIGIYPIKPVVYITEINVNNKKCETKTDHISIPFNKHIILKHNQSSFNLEYSAISYIAPDITQYAYCMEGLDTKWTYITGDHKAYFTKLSPGQYTFKVKAANVSGVWTEEPTLLHITILPPWWLSPVAWFVYVLIAFVTCALVIWSVIRHNKEAIRRQMQTFESDKEKELYRAKINFFINIAHEIRTPLTLIKSPLDKVISHTELPPDAKSYLDIVNKNANRLLALVNQLLDFRKTEIKEYSLNFIKTDIVSLLYETAERFRDTAEQESLQLSIETEIPSYPVFIDNEACTKILSNLLSNAVKYARSHIIIKFAILNEDRFAIDMVNDGEKISEETKEKIFEPFFRGESSAHKSGTGLGLPLARSLAEMHRGTLELTDAHQPFITFRLCLPVNQPHSIKFADDEKVTPPTTYIPTYTTEQSRPTILVVEDNKEMQYFIGQEVNSIYNVVVADNGQEALAVLEEYGIQLIISDIMMPLMDGFTLLKKVKTNLEFSHIPVILLTARNTVQSRLEGLELGADAYMDKPFSMDLLLAQIVNLLNNRNSIRSYYFNSPIVHMKSMAYTKADENFLDKLNDIINLHINNVELDVDMIAGQMNLSRPTLYRKINALSNLTPNDLIKLTRLKKAAELILQGNMKIYEISEAVGFNSQSYFSRAFSKQFNMSPSQYAKVNNVELG